MSWILGLVVRSEDAWFRFVDMPTVRLAKLVESSLLVLAS